MYIDLQGTLWHIEDIKKIIEKDVDKEIEKR